MHLQAWKNTAKRKLELEEDGANSPTLLGKLIIYQNRERSVSRLCEIYRRTKRNPRKTQNQRSKKKIQAPGCKCVCVCVRTRVLACMCSIMQSCLILWGPWTGAHQALLLMEFSRQECWSGLPFLTPGNLPNPGIEPMSPTLSGGFFTTSTTWETLDVNI